MDSSQGKTGYFTPEKQYKKCFLWSLISLMAASILFYIDYTSPTNHSFNELTITSGTLKAPAVANGLVRLETLDKKILYFPQGSGKGGRNYWVDFRNYHNQKVKIWWYPDNPYKVLGRSYIYQMEAGGKLVISYETQKSIYSGKKYFPSKLLGLVSLILFIFGVVGYISSKDNKQYR